MIKKEILNGKTFLDLENAEIYYLPNFLEPRRAWDLFHFLLKTIPWKQEKIRIFGKWMNEPRLTCWMGDANANYKYSGNLRKPIEWIKRIFDIKEEIEKLTNTDFNAVLLNLYRDGKDSNAWHRDNEKELGEDPKIVSLSLGETRIMEFRSLDKQKKRKIALEHGSLLFMGTNSQLWYEHQIPKSKFIDKPRINLTFRHIKQGKTHD